MSSAASMWLDYASAAEYVVEHDDTATAANALRTAANEVEYLREKLTQKEGELAVAYGGADRDGKQQEWFSALDRANAEVERLRRALDEIVAWFGSGIAAPPENPIHDIVARARKALDG